MLAEVIGHVFAAAASVTAKDFMKLLKGKIFERSSLDRYYLEMQLTRISYQSNLIQ